MNWTNKIEVFNEDCMETMSRYKDDYFDLAVVDPPYGINVNMNIGLRKGQKKRHKQKNWDKASPTKEYFKELFRVSKNQIIWGGNNFILPTSQFFAIWDKGESMYGRSFAECEYAWVRKGGTRIIKLFPNQKGRIHPTQKPISLYQWIYQNYAKEGYKILDTHFGSGSNGIAIDSVNKIEKLNLSLVASEIDKDYYLSAKKRFQEKTAWSSLFV